jgi:hypothetical protein
VKEELVMEKKEFVEESFHLIINAEKKGEDTVTGGKWYFGKLKNSDCKALMFILGDFVCLIPINDEKLSVEEYFDEYLSCASEYFCSQLAKGGISYAGRKSN